MDWHGNDTVPDKLSVDIAQRATELLEMYKNNIIAGVRATEAGGYCEFIVDFSDGIKCNVGALYRIVSLSRLMALAAIVAEHRGASKETVFTYLFAANRCLRMLDGFPISAVSIARSVASMRGQSLAIKLVDRLDFADQQLRLLTKEIKTAGEYHATRIAIIGDRVLGTYAFDDTNVTLDIIYGTINLNAELDLTNPLSLKAATRQKMKRFAATHAKEDRQFFREAMDALLEIADTPHHVAYKKLVKLEAELQSGELAKQRGVRGMLTPMLLPQVGAIEELQINAEAINELASGVLAMKLFHIKNGRFPKDSSELIPMYLDSRPHDPWTGHTAVARLSGRTLEIRSAGKNQIIETDAADSDDLVVKLEF